MSSFREKCPQKAVILKMVTALDVTYETRTEMPELFSHSHNAITNKRSDATCVCNHFHQLIKQDKRLIISDLVNTRVLFRSLNKVHDLRFTGDLRYCTDDLLSSLVFYNLLISSDLFSLI